MNHKILIIGEAYGENEEREQTPFVGYTGQELTRMLSEAGIERRECYLTNVFNFRPAGNRIEEVCGGLKTSLPGYPRLGKAGYVREEFLPELERLGDEILSSDPNLILALGNTAMWAVLGRTAITKYRGTTDLSTHLVEGYKVLPTYHPSAVVRNWDLRPVVLLDLMKAKREAEYPEVRRPEREIWIEPTIEDLHAFKREHIHAGVTLSTDIETSGDQITCIGFAPRPDISLVIPFYDPRRKTRSYWEERSDEILAWKFVREVCEDDTIPKLFQNGMYDIAFIWRTTGIRVMNAAEDTMLLHHALQPESLKGLGFLGSLYTDEGAWKVMRKAVTTIKRDE